MIIYIHIFTDIHWWDNVSFYKKIKNLPSGRPTLWAFKRYPQDTAGSVAGYETQRNSSTRHWIDHGIYETRRDNTRWMLIRMHNKWPKTRFPLIRYTHIPSANTHFNMHFCSKWYMEHLNIFALYTLLFSGVIKHILHCIYNEFKWHIF